MTVSFYRNPVELNPNAHGGRGLRIPMDFSFAAQVNAWPLGVEEIPLAALWYPIVVAGDPGHVVAVVGLRPGENLFVDASGAWLKGAYIPAAVRRYPFLLAEGREGVTLYIDDHPAVLSEDGGSALFDDQDLTPLTQKAFDFCLAVRAGEAEARDFVEVLQRGALLESKQAETKLGAAGQHVRMNGLSVINEKAIRALPDATFLALRQRNWLPAIFAQIQSTLNWHRLNDLLVERIQA